MIILRKKDVSKLPIVCFVLLLPYNNVPYIQQGVLKPFSIFPLLVCTFIYGYYILYEQKKKYFSFYC
jgi:hypothetical protein